MRNSLRELGLLPGVTVSIVADTGIVFIGQVRGWRGERHHSCDIIEDDDEFILIQLTTATGPYAAGSIIAISIDSIISVGPVVTV